MRCIILSRKKIVASVAALTIITVGAATIFCAPKTVEVFQYNTAETLVKKELGVKKDITLGILEENPLVTLPEPTHNPTPTPTEEILTPPPAKSSNDYGEMKVRNESGYDVNLLEFSKKDLPFSVNDDGAQVLIMHTHTTECYSSSEITKYSVSENGRTTNDRKNMIAIGKIIADELNKNGISTIHDTTVHDYPIYNHAYTRAAATISGILKQNPGIKAVLDIHRDSIGDGSSKKLTATLPTGTAAQIMIVAGTDKNGLTHTNWQDNLIFASKLQHTTNELYPGLMRPLNLRAERFNQHLTPGSLIIEVGSNTNTLEEAKLAASAFSEVIIKVLS